MHVQLIKSMKASLMKQTADALKACQAAAKPAKAAKGAAVVKKGEGDSAHTIPANLPQHLAVMLIISSLGIHWSLRGIPPWLCYASGMAPIDACPMASPVKQ